MTYFKTIIRLILIEAVRSRLPWLLLIVIAVAFGLSQFLGQVAIIEHREIQATLQGAFLRMTAVFIIATFVITSMVREANDKVTELLLSQPAARATYYFGKLAGYATVAALVAVIFALPLVFFAPLPALLAWTISLACELSMMAAMSLFCVLSLTQILPALSATAAFYLLGRSLAAMKLIAAASVATQPTFADQAISAMVGAVSLVLPSIDQMTISEWLVSAPSVERLLTAVGQAILFTALLAAASLFDVNRKNL